MSKYVRFLPVAQAFADMSKDPSTKVGAVALDEKMNIVSAGYNGFPRGVDDSPARYFDRATKYQLVSHAEANLVAQAAYGGRSLAGSTVLVVPLHPCSACAKLLVQAGVAQIFCPLPGSEERWHQESVWAKLILDEAGVVVRYVEKAEGHHWVALGEVGSSIPD